MAEWEYLEAQYSVTDGSPTKLFIIGPYAELYGFDITKPYELTELGKDRWNLTLSVTDLESNNSRMIFRRPKGAM